MNKVLLRDLRVKMNIGILPHERGKKQFVLVSVDVTLSPDIRWTKDVIEETVRYDELAERIEKIAQRGHFDLLETYAELIAADFLQMDLVQSVRVCAEKPGILKKARSAAIEIFRTK